MLWSKGYVESLLTDFSRYVIVLSHDRLERLTRGAFFQYVREGISQSSFQLSSLWIILLKVPMFVSTARYTTQMWMRVAVRFSYKVMANKQPCALALWNLICGSHQPKLLWVRQDVSWLLYSFGSHLTADARTSTGWRIDGIYRYVWKWLFRTDSGTVC